MRGLIVILGLAACGGSGGGDPGDDGGADDGAGDDGGGDDGGGAPDAAADPARRVVITFAATNGVRQSPNLDGALVGTVYGQLFASEDVSILGPADGATEYGAVEVAGVDLTTATTAGTWTSGDLAPGSYTFLGFFDIDGNGATDRAPDAGDPVTIPTTNAFEIVAGQQAPVMLTAEFDFVYN